MMAKLGWPMLLCHGSKSCVGRSKVIGSGNPIRNDSRSKAFQSLRYRVLAAGDSYNDIPMLDQADAGFFYRCPPTVASEYPQFPRAESYQALQDLLESNPAVA